MTRAAQTFIRGVFSLHPLWQLWLAVMGFVNGVWPLWFLPDTAAVVVLASMLSAMALGMVLTHLHGFSKILGLMHAPWIPMVAALAMLHPGFESVGHYVIWLTTSIVISLASLVIDACDVAIFLRSNGTADDANGDESVV